MSIAAGITAGGAGAAGSVTGGFGAAAGAIGSATAPISAAVGAVGAVGAAVANGVNSVLNALAVVRIPATLACVEPPNIGVVPFDFNPDQIDFSRTATVTNRPSMTATSGQPSGGTGAIVRKVTPPNIKLNNLVLEGLTTKLRCDQLLRWMSPFSGLPGLGGLGGATTKSILPTITFTWGPPMVAFLYQVRITSLNISYVRFNAMGMPIRAKVSLQLQEVPSLLASLPTNPTSGGLPGRRTHTVVDGDSLQSIATATYGRPGAWRRIAAVNRIHNPSRLRPGTTIYLPNPDELTDGSMR
jgi:nucleoid-associated protein YgaU